MKIIRDERLKLQNLKNIRIAYIIQTLGIIGILGYDLLMHGMEKMKDNPLWILFILSNSILLLLSMNISVAYEGNKKSPKKSFTISVFVITIISIVIGGLVVISKESSLKAGVIMGLIVFICGLLPTTYLYRLRKRQADDLE